MIITRTWAMPNHKTFSIKPIQELIARYHKPENFSIDPFACDSKLASTTNDLNPEYKTDFNLDALEFLRSRRTNSVDLVFYDPPYSPRQISECYKKFKRSVNMQTTQSSFWSNLKTEIARTVKSNGLVLSFGWNSGGIGKTLGFKQIEILLVAHGGAHNDTICVVERKMCSDA